MAKTNGKNGKTKGKSNGKSKHAETDRVGRQAPREVWSLEEMLAVYKNRTDEERIISLKSAGILDENGKLAEFYTREGGDDISRACSDVYLS